MSQKPLWSLRPLVPSDIPFVFNSWLKSYRESPQVVGVPNTVFYDKFHQVIEQILPKSVVIVAHDPEDQSIIYGYVVAEYTGRDLVFHWVYVKHPFRNFGLAKALEQEILTIAHQSVYYTPRTRTIDSIMKSRNYTYDPFLLWSNVK